MSESFTITGPIVKIGDTEQKSATFSVRDLVLLLKDGEYENFAVLQFVGDKTALLDSVSVGQVVEVAFNIRGREWNGRHFTNLQGWKITAKSEAARTSPDAGGGFDHSVPFAAVPSFP